jgi:hypothetical protein
VFFVIFIGLSFWVLSGLPICFDWGDPMAGQPNGLKFLGFVDDEGQTW